jgi:signal transduction histidine kinase
MPGSDRVIKMPRPPLSRRVTPRQWAAVDVAAAVVTMLIMTFSLRVRGFHAAIPSPGMAAVTIAASLPVAVRRLWPLPVLAVVTAGVSILTAAGNAQLTSDLMIGMASYMAAVRLRRSVAVTALVAVEAAIGAGLLTAAATAHAQNVMLHSMLAAAAMWFVGFGVRERRAYQVCVAEQAAQQRQADAERNRHVLQQERLLIARELHDVLAHTLSVVAVQAGVGRRVGLARPDEALRALGTVEEASRGALDELRRVLCLLRNDDEPATAGAAAGEAGPARPDASAAAPALTPVPGLGDLDSLAAMVRAAGTPVEVDVTGDVAAVSTAAALTAYRIVQEALTNVVRHAPGARATVAMRITAAGVRIRVTDTGRPGGPAGTAGTAGAGRHGIVGMRERAAVFGGTLNAVPLPGGGFRVTAFLPVPATGPVGVRAVAAGRVA